MIKIETFTFKPYGQVEKTPEFYNRVVQFESGKKQKQGGTTQAQTMWKLQLSGINDERIALESFFVRHQGDLKSFYWVDVDNVQHTVRFAQGKLPIVVKREGGVPVAYTCEILLEKVI